MWFFPTKKEVKKEFEKIFKAFKKRDDDIEDIKKDLVSKKEIELMIKEAVIDLKLQFGQYSEPKSEHRSEPNKKGHFERVMIKKANKTRPEVIKQAIRGLLDRDLKTTDIYNTIVNEKKLCGKTQFYHYLSLVRSEVRTIVQTEVRTEPKRKL